MKSVFCLFKSTSMWGFTASRIGMLRYCLIFSNPLSGNEFLDCKLTCVGDLTLSFDRIDIALVDIPWFLIYEPNFEIVFGSMRGLMLTIECKWLCNDGSGLFGWWEAGEQEY